MPSPILCVGELLWDSLPAGLFPGGAPFNVAYHLTCLGVDAVVASSVGDDVLGHILLQHVAGKGLATDLIQVQEAVPTGLVHAVLDEHGVPAYDIVKPSAWDCITMTDRLGQAAKTTSALVFGSLAQRESLSRKTIRALLNVDTLRVFDVNLRPPYDDKGVVQQCLPLSQVVKLNEDEFSTLARWFSLPPSLREGTEAMARRFGPQAICVTRGANGAGVWHNGEWTEHGGFRVAVCDTIGAGDAFLASFLKGFLDGCDDAAILRCANAYGAYVAASHGATPPLDLERLSTIESSKETA